MKNVILLSAILFVAGMPGGAYAQSATTKATTESGRIISDSVSDTAKDAMKQMDHKSGDMKEAEDMKKKAEDADKMMKMKSKMKQ